MATIATIQTNQVVPPSGLIELMKIEFKNLTYHVCNDHIWDEGNRYKDLWILDDNGGTDGNCHWLKDREPTNGDMNKPEILPITFKKDYKIKFEATFRLKVDLTGEITVFARGYRRTNRDLLIVNEKDKISGGSKDDLVTLTFETGNIFNDIIYTSIFDLDFFYKKTAFPSETPLKKTTFRHYVTYKDPKFTSFENNGLPETNLQIEHSGKQYICESLLYLSCKPCSGKKLTSETSILDSIFKQFLSKKILRTRVNENDKRPAMGSTTSYYLPLIDETNGMGYWRDESSIPTARREYASSASPYPLPTERLFEDGSRRKAPLFGGQRSIRFLLAYGVARCGEWTELLKHLILVQGFDRSNLSDAAIATTSMNQIIHQDINNYEASHPGVTIVRDPYLYLEDSADYDTSYDSKDFTVVDAIFEEQSGNIVITGDSWGQGNRNAQPHFIDHFWFYHTSNNRFYDPSYGFTMSEAESDFKIYINKYIKSMIAMGKDPSSIKTDRTEMYKYLKSKTDIWKGK